jgi:thiol-disulfide isomerase/thioredoxin
MFDTDMALAGPLHILLADDPYAYMLEGVREIVYVGEEKFTGTRCHKIRMMTEEGQVDYWFKARGKPMLVRIVPDPPPPLPVIRFAMGGTANAADNELSYTFKNWKIKRKIPGRVFTFKPSKVSEEVDFDAAMASLSSGDKPLLGEKAPTFKLDLHDGGKVDLASHIGRDVVILDFWASWCGPCRMGMPIIEEVAGRFKDKGVVFYAVNLREDKSTVDGYLTSTGLDLTVAMDKRGSVAGKYGVSGIPHTVIIGKDGKVRDVHIGFSNALREQLTSMLNKLIAE